MRHVSEPIKLPELKKIAENRFGNMVKAVVDIKRQIMVIDAELHADQEAKLLAEGSKQENLWGINLYPDKKGDEFIEYDSMINVRPSSNNFDRGINDENIRKKVEKIVDKLVAK